MKMKHAIPLITAVCMLFAGAITVSASTNPIITPKHDSVSVNHQDKTDTVKFSVKDWKDTKGYIVMFEVMDPDICTVTLDDKSADEFKLRFKAKNTGVTAVKVWLDGFRATAQYITVRSSMYQTEDVGDIKVKHYGYMTGTKGEQVLITDLKESDGRFTIYFDYIDSGYNTTDTVELKAKASEDDGDPIGTVTISATGLVVGGKGYKATASLPAKTCEVKLENADL